MREFKTIIAGVVYQFHAINQASFMLELAKINKKVKSLKPSQINVIEL